MNIFNFKQNLLIIFVWKLYNTLRKHKNGNHNAVFQWTKLTMVLLLFQVSLVTQTLPSKVHEESSFLSNTLNWSLCKNYRCVYNKASEKVYPFFPIKSDFYPVSVLIPTRSIIAWKEILFLRVNYSYLAFKRLSVVETRVTWRTFQSQM